MTTHSQHHRPFRFGVIAGPASDSKTWLDLARRAEDSGYSTLCLPDTLWTPSPFPALAAAAAVTTTLRLAPHVLAAPFRTPGMVARDTEALDLLSEGRFELAMGIGRPDSAGEAARLGMRFGSGAERLALVETTIRTVRSHFASKNRTAPRIELAGSGPKLLRLAAAEADTLTWGLPHDVTEEGLATKVGELQALAGERYDAIEQAVNISAIGDEIPEWITQRLGAIPSDSYTLLTGSVDEMVDVLRRRRDRLGISYVTVSQSYLEQFAPVVARLAGS